MLAEGLRVEDVGSAAACALHDDCGAERSLGEACWAAARERAKMGR